MQKVYCNNCEKEITPVDNKCPKCGLEFEDNVIKENTISTEFLSNKNTISQIVKVLGVVIVIINFISLKDESVSFLSGLLILLWHGCMLLSFFVVAEFLQILHDIRRKIYESK